MEQLDGVELTTQWGTPLSFEEWMEDTRLFIEQSDWSMSRDKLEEALSVIRALLRAADSAGGEQK